MAPRVNHDQARQSANTAVSAIRTISLTLPKMREGDAPAAPMGGVAMGMGSLYAAGCLGAKGRGGAEDDGLEGSLCGLDGLGYPVTFHEQDGDVVFIEPRVYERLQERHRVAGSIGEGFAQTIFGMVAGDGIG